MSGDGQSVIYFNFQPLHSVFMNTRTGWGGGGVVRFKHGVTNPTFTVA